MNRCLVTGANGHLGRRLIPSLARRTKVVAFVRSERARHLLNRYVDDVLPVSVHVGNPADPDALAEAAAGCDSAVHLIGTIKASRQNPIRDSHETPAAALVEAAPRASIRHIVYVSILGASPTSASVCLRARANVEAMLGRSPVASTVIRVPMVLGERDRASFALAKRAAAQRAVVFRDESLEQPIYAGDVVAAMERVLEQTPVADGVFDLAGPASLPRRELIAAAAAVLGGDPSIVSLPLWCGMLLAGLFEVTRSDPPITRDMLRILDHDDAINPWPAAKALGIPLTPLEDMLERCIAGRLG